MSSSFAIDDIHIGPPCRKSCSDFDKCVGASCKCDKRFNGNCLSSSCLTSKITTECKLTSLLLHPSLFFSFDSSLCSSTTSSRFPKTYLFYNPTPVVSLLPPGLPFTDYCLERFFGAARFLQPVITSMSVVGPKCTPAALHAAPWCVTLSMLTRQIDGQTGGRQTVTYIMLSAGHGQR